MKNQRFLCCPQAKLAARATEYCLNPALYSEKQIQEFFIIEGVQACSHSSDFFTAYYKPFPTQYTYATLRFKYSHLNSVNISSLKGVFGSAMGIYGVTTLTSIQPVNSKDPTTSKTVPTENKNTANSTAFHGTLGGGLTN